MLHDIAHSVAPFIWGGIALTMITLRHRRKMAAIATTTAPIDTTPTDHAREVAQLRDRVRVLERIATDAAKDERRDNSSQKLAARIEALRD